MSLLPAVEGRVRFGPFAPYGLMGLGLNINVIDEDGVFAAANRDLDMDETVAFKLAGGVDFFVRRDLALNVEMGWRLNDADIDIKNVPFFGTVETSADASAFSMLFGVRYYFDAQRR